MLMAGDMAYLDRVSFESLPILPTGACLLSGVSALVPVVVKIAGLPPEATPNSRTMSVATEWVRQLSPASTDDEEAADSADLGVPTWDDEPPFLSCPVEGCE